LRGAGLPQAQAWWHALSGPAAYPQRPGCCLPHQAQRQWRRVLRHSVSAPAGQDRACQRIHHPAGRGIDHPPVGV